MSLAIKRTQFQGDPGIFGFLGGVAGKVASFAGGLGQKIGLPGAGFVSAAGSALSGLSAGKVAARQKRVAAGLPILPEAQVFDPKRSRPGLGFNPLPRPRGLPTQTFFGGSSTAVAAAQQAGTTIACPSGFKPNKSDYFLKSGEFVPEGTRCVRIRRRNPFNPRAIDRAIGRIEGGKRAAGRLNRITIRKKC